MLKFLLCLGLVVCCCQGRPKVCQAPYVPVGSQCLFFGTLAELTQDEARQMCHSLNGELAAILTATQFKDLMDYIYSHGYEGSNFWIDGSDSGHEGQWLTSDGKALPMGTPFWSTTYVVSEPNNSGDNENCLEIDSFYLYYLNDKLCTTLNSPLCEMKDEAIAGNHCVAFITWAQNTWAEARQVCHGLGGELATVDDIELLRDIYLYIHLESISDHSFWIGGSDIDSEGTWTWTNGESIRRGTPFWGRRDEDHAQEPVGGTAENCLYLDHIAGHYFFDGSCGLLLNPLCMTQ